MPAPKTIAAMPAIALAACAFALPALGEGTAIEMQLLPAGNFVPSDGRALTVPSWQIDAAIAARVIAASTARANALVIDYEHQTLRKEENGQPAPAAGWIRALTWHEGRGLFATVDLTARARAMIEAGEYRYVSPVFIYDATTGEVLAIQMAALTNTPAIDGMEPLALRAAASFGCIPPIPPAEPTRGDTMNELLKALYKMLGLAETASETEALVALTAIQPRLAAYDGLRAELGLADDAAPDAAVAACTALKTRAEATPAEPDPAKYVPVGVVKELQTQVAALTAEQVQGKVATLVEAGLADGRILPAQKDWATQLGMKDVAALTAYLDTASPIAALAGTQTRGAPPAGGANEHGLTATELAVCTATGVRPEDFAKARAA